MTIKYHQEDLERDYSEERYRVRSSSRNRLTSRGQYDNTRYREKYGDRYDRYDKYNSR